MPERVRQDAASHSIAGEVVCQDYVKVVPAFWQCIGKPAEVYACPASGGARRDGSEQGLIKHYGWQEDDNVLGSYHVPGAAKARALFGRRYTPRIRKGERDGCIPGNRQHGDVL